MFGLFTPSCPIELQQKTWIEYRMCWLAEKLGIERLRSAPVILPTEDYFPNTYSPTLEGLQSLLHYLAGLMGITTSFDIEIAHDTEMPYASGLYISGNPPKIVVKDSILADPYDVSATLTHELAHDILLGGKLLDANEADHEQVTDLLMIYLGVGIIPANNTIKDRQWSDGQMHYFQIRRSGYLAARDFGYAFALFAHMRGEEYPAWGRYLRPDCQSVLKKGLKFLRKTGDTLFREDRFRETLRPPESGKVIDALREGTPTEQLFTLWQLQRQPLNQPAVVEHVERKLKDSNWFIAASAADALGARRTEGASSVTPLLDALNASNSRVRLSAAAALGQIGLEPERVIPALSDVLMDYELSVAAHAANALYHFGEKIRLVDDLSSRLLRVLDAAMYGHAPHETTTPLFLAYLIAEPEPVRAIETFYEGGNDEHRDELLDVIESLQDSLKQSTP